MATIVEQDNLRQAYRQVKANAGAAGVDGMTVETFADPNGGERQLGIPALEDKLVQLACAKVLNAIYEQDCLDFSNGYRPNRSAKETVADLIFNLQYGCYGYSGEADIKSFFDQAS